jgi:hypothetical protein
MAEVAKIKIIDETGVKVVRVPQSAPAVRTIRVGIPGPQGPPGQSGVQFLEALAGENLSGHRAVFVFAEEAFYASNTDETAESVIGVTIGSSLQGDAVQILTDGEIEEPSWNWTPGIVFLGENGFLTQVAPASGAIVEVGVALAPTRLLVRIQSAQFLLN